MRNQANAVEHVEPITRKCRDLTDHICADLLWPLVDGQRHDDVEATLCWPHASHPTARRCAILIGEARAGGARSLDQLDVMLAMAQQVSENLPSNTSRAARRALQMAIKLSFAVLHNEMILRLDLAHAENEFDIIGNECTDPPALAAAFVLLSVALPLARGEKLGRNAVCGWADACALLGAVAACVPADKLDVAMAAALGFAHVVFLKRVFARPTQPAASSGANAAQE